MEGAALTHLALDADLTAHQLHEPAGDGQPQAGAPVLARGGGIGLAEGGEELAPGQRRDADAGVLDLEPHAVRRGGVGGHGDDHLALVSEFHRVADKVGEHLADPVGVAADTRGQGGMHPGRELDSAVVRAAGKHPGGFLDHVGQREVDRVELELARLDLREVQDVGDEHQERIARRGRGLRVGALLGVERSVHQEVRRSDDAVERRTDLVAHVREELRLRSRGGDGVGVNELELLPGAPSLGDVLQKGVEGMAGVRLESRDRQLDGKLVAVTMKRRQLEALADDRPLAGRQEALDSPPVSLALGHGDDRSGQVSTDRLVAGPAEALLRLWIPVRHDAGRVDRDEGVVRGLQDLSRLPPTRLQSRLGLLAIGDVARGGIDQAVVQHGDRAPVDPAPPTVLVGIAVDEVDRDVTRAQPGGLPLGHLAVVRMNELHERARAQLLLTPSERLRPRGVQLGEHPVEAGGAQQVARDVEVTGVAPQLGFQRKTCRLVAIETQGEVPQHSPEDRTGPQRHQQEADLGAVKPFPLAHPPQKAEQHQGYDRHRKQATNHQPSRAVAGQQVLVALSRSRDGEAGPWVLGHCSCLVSGGRAGVCPAYASSARARWNLTRE